MANELHTLSIAGVNYPIQPLSFKAASNTITTTANDTTANWGGLGCTVHYYATAGQLTGQPSRYGFLANYSSGSEVHQLWMTQATGSMYHRGGNSNGWFGGWRCLVDDNNYSTWFYNKTDTDNRINTAIANLVNSAPDTLNTLKELSDALGADPNFATTITNHLANKANKDGSNATGKWPISITGHAGSAGTVAWGNITGKPTLSTIFNKAHSASSTGPYYYKLGTLPVSTSSTCDSFVIRGTIGSWYSVSKSHIDVSVSRRDGITFKGFIHDMRSSIWNLGVNNAGEVILVITDKWAAWSLELHTLQGTIDYTEDPYTPADTNITYITNSANVVKFTNAGRAVMADGLGGYSCELAANDTTNTWVPVFVGGAIRHRIIPAAYNNDPSTLSVNYANSAGSAVDQTARDSAASKFPLTGGLMSGDNRYIGSTMAGGTDSWMIGGYGSNDNGECRITIKDNSNDKFAVQIEDYSGTTYRPLVVDSTGVAVTGSLSVGGTSVSLNGHTHSYDNITTGSTVNLKYSEGIFNTIGWKKIAIDNKNQTGSIGIININRTYNNNDNEVYTFLINCTYNGNTNITQIGGKANQQLITKIAVYNPPSPYDRIIYIYYNSTSTNTVKVNCIGDFSAITGVAETIKTTNITELDTISAGFKTNGYIAGNIDASYLKLNDIRGTAHAPNSTNYPAHKMVGWFNNSGTPSADWWSGFTVKGWTNDYASWQLCSYSSTGTANDYDLYFRNGINSTWGSWKTVITSGNIGSQSVAYATTAGSANSVAWSNVSGKPSFAKVATSGSYNDLSNKPTIPTIPTSLPANGGNADTVDNLHASDFLRAYGTLGAGNSYDSDWGQSVVTFDPIVNGTYPERNPNVTILNLGNNYGRRKQLAFNYNNNNIYFRRKVDNAWTPWVRLALASEIPSFAKVATSGSYNDLSDVPIKHYEIDLAGKSTSNFYPCYFESSDLETDCEIHSPNVGGDSAWNQNRIHFLLTSQGWSDTGNSFVVLSHSVYSTTEVTIGAIARGNHGGAHCVWLRGGLKYRIKCNKTPNCPGTDVTNGNEKFTIGTNYDGGTNANITVLWKYGDTTQTSTHVATKGYIGNGTVTIKQNGTSKGTFTMNQSGNTTIELTDTNTDTWRPVTDSVATTSSSTCASATAVKKAYDLAASKGSGTVTSITPGTGLTNGTGETAITSTGTLNLKVASANEIGGIKIGYSASGKNYPVQLDSNNKAYVNVPWTDNNTDTSTNYNGHYTPTGSAKTGTASGSTLSFGGAVVTGLTYDGKGHVTGFSTSKLPSNPNTDSNVTSNATTSSAYYLCGSTSSSAVTGTLVKRSNVVVNASGQLHVAAGFFESSDERLKNFGESLDVDLDKIKELPKKYFTWKNDKDNKLNIGTSAQELQKLYPEIVSEDVDGYLTVAYDKLSIIALAAIDKLVDKQKELEERLAKIEAALNL